MIRPKQIRRLLHIQRVLVRHGLDELVLATHLFRPIRFVGTLSPNYWLGAKDEPRGVRIRRTLEDLGPIFVKFGQTLSTRRDLLPDDIAEELIKLQDRVPAFPGSDAKAIVEQALGQPVSLVFAEFEETPLASASVAQVHAARLHDGQDVVVKVLRPGIEKQIRSDIALLYELARLAQRFWSDAKRLRPIEVVAEFEKTILDELDLVREAANAAEMRRRFEDSEILYIPKVYWPYTRRQVLVMERISGIPVGDVETLKREGVDFKLLAERGVEIFFTQVLRDSFFHADMHPGNIFVTPPAQYIAVDFGIVGSISREDKRYVAENLLAFFNRDYRRVAEMHIESGWIPKTTRVEEFESAVRAVSEPIFEKPLKDISYGHLLLRLFQVARRFDMEVQPQLVLLQKTLLNIEGLGRDLYPDLDLWQTAKPFLERWFKDEMGPKAGLRKIQSQLPEWAESWPEMPMLIHRMLENAATGKLTVTFQSRELEQIHREITQNRRRTLTGITGGALVISAAVLSGSAASLTVAGIAGALGVLLLVGAWL
ncbi:MULTISPECIES: ubiquinone biosynthesis regulatory protein kinase UbiB [unclassified Methylocaldum]|uniref:ubiquinone biosynthesis regulatory protein kinase UbiB n=1 Tax=unclassified Methylocaldum TaxID=2622260 RepID=UPI00098B10F3|nr:ubiquinone biosynthesis regulatory protein kinase UbiB [Methylocaldum sp. 14B]MBP1149796.1 ubiquinone biosynthesis protein [Methylocaldum sp. RMAD-M]MVF22178.1 ubiquinone biosynthesis regulatory protein kinase UbiB [Methylocaldum sp. BRCS4]